MTLFFALMACISIVLGGALGIKYKDKSHLVLGLTAGMLIGIVAFDLLPEIFEMTTTLGTEVVGPMIFLVGGFLVFHIFEKLLLIHHGHEEHYGEHKHPTVGIASALALSTHSFLDGVSIGLGFQASTVVGIGIAIAVISHGFSDGLNSVSIALNHKNSVARSLRLLMINAAAPLLGAAISGLVRIPMAWLVNYLGFLAGFLLYIGASEILPEAHSEHSSISTILMTILGVVIVLIVTQITGH